MCHVKNMKHLFIIFTLISFNACSQDKQKNEIDVDKLSERIQYVISPSPNDSLCISEIKRATNDLKNLKKQQTFTAPIKDVLFYRSNKIIGTISGMLQRNK